MARAEWGSRDPRWRLGLWLAALGFVLLWPGALLVALLGWVTTAWLVRTAAGRRIWLRRVSACLPLVALVEAVAGDKLKDAVRAELVARGPARFLAKGDATTFANEGPEIKIPLAKFDIKIPKRISGSGRVAGEGVSLRFADKETLAAKKLLVSVKLRAVELSSERVVVDMGGDLFDQVYLLG